VRQAFGQVAPTGDLVVVRGYYDVLVTDGGEGATSRAAFPVGLALPPQGALDGAVGHAVIARLPRM
jgi:hypothetical protein